jgi:hypothetical protein
VFAYGSVLGTVIGDLMSCSSCGDAGPPLVFCAATTSHIPFRFAASGALEARKVNALRLVG